MSPLAPVPPKAKRYFVCPWPRCGKVLRTKATLTGHVRDFHKPDFRSLSSRPGWHHGEWHD
jgi:hypothetical protein